MFLELVRKLFIRVQLFMTRSEGASAIEYALIIAMVALVVISFVTPMGGAIKTTFNSLLTQMGAPAVP
ncbi:pilus assembly protein Flp/PilA [Pseudomonas sp. ok272]|uniref:Flp family type IVb pilin n=1 Tax=unclassified Pseudomonas TaxID=196821 RepID=UPI0008C92E39|nr:MULTISPECIES: Flp family type IVb pilin [unclassified Pseudomonas]SEM89665.1 pilus assembly protein Flp/PilA [Pseudomonas sp. ok272]SFM73543.1 pilus assembly protein Flp/PilA [Pseudomonas sp. ok602]